VGGYFSSTEQRVALVALVELKPVVRSEYRVVLVVLVVLVVVVVLLLAPSLSSRVCCECSCNAWMFFDVLWCSFLCLAVSYCSLLCAVCCVVCCVRCCVRALCVHCVM
jgi:hypothetical protein